MDAMVKMSDTSKTKTDGVDPNCKECNGFGWHPNKIRFGWWIPGEFRYTPCKTCHGSYRNQFDEVMKVTHLTSDYYLTRQS